MTALTEKEIETYVELKSENLTYEETFDLLENITNSFRESGGSLLDKLLWVTRCTYLVGFKQGLGAYNNAVKAQED
jgi:hypothetical protein